MREYVPLLLALVIAALFAGGTIAMSHFIVPRRRDPPVTVVSAGSPAPRKPSLTARAASTACGSTAASSLVRRRLSRSRPLPSPAGAQRRPDRV